MGMSYVDFFGANQMEVERAAIYINVRIAGIFLFGTFIVGFNPADFWSFVFGKAKDCVLWFNHE